MHLKDNYYEIQEQPELRRIFGTAPAAGFMR